MYTFCYYRNIYWKYKNFLIFVYCGKISLKERSAIHLLRKRKEKLLKKIEEKKKQLFVQEKKEKKKYAKSLT